MGASPAVSLVFALVCQAALWAPPTLRRCDACQALQVINLIDFQCSQCGACYQRVKSHGYYGKLTFCSNECRNISNRKGGKIYEKKKATLMKNYGVDDVFLVPGVRDAAQSALLDKFGAKGPFKDPAIREKAFETMEDRYGVKHSRQIPGMQERVELTCLERYGFTHHMKSEEVKSKFDYELMPQKIHDGMKRNGTYAKQQSKVEDHCFNELIQLFKVVERHVVVNKRWPIDIFVRDVNVFVQVDGVYWHGLDRSLDQILESEDVRDVQILKKIITDRNQNEWFRDNGLRLVRVTDKEVERWRKEGTLRDELMKRVTMISQTSS